MSLPCEYILIILVLTHFIFLFNKLKQLVLYLLQRTLFAPCRYCILLDSSSLNLICKKKKNGNVTADLSDFLQVLSQDETPLLYSLVFGEGVVNDATSVVLFNAIQSFDITNISHRIALQFVGNFFYLFVSSTMLGVLVSSLSLFHFFYGRMFLNLGNKF